MHAVKGLPFTAHQQDGIACVQLLCLVMWFDHDEMRLAVPVDHLGAGGPIPARAVPIWISASRRTRSSRADSGGFVLRNNGGERAHRDAVERQRGGTCGQRGPHPAESGAPQQAGQQCLPRSPPWCPEYKQQRR